MKTTEILLMLLFWPLASVTQGAEPGQMHVALARNGTNFTYTLFNDELPGSSLFLSSFYLQVNAPFLVTSSPAGWKVETDSLTYVNWYCADPGLPYQHQIAPGASLTGFALLSQVDSSKSLNCVITSWDQVLASPGAGHSDFVESPCISDFAPRLTNLLYLGSGAIKVTVYGVPAFNYAVGYSSDLISWTLVSTNAAPFDFIDSHLSTKANAFYRSNLIPDGVSSPLLGD
jgi:hypothetical protein